MKMRKSVPWSSFDILNYITLSIFTFICIYPFYYILIYSISSASEAERGLLFLPKGIHLLNYSSVMELSGVYEAFLVSLARTVIGTVATVFSCSMFAYIVSKKELYFRRLIYRFVVLTLYFNAGLIPWYLLMKALHLNNSFLLYILPSAVSGFFVILIKTFMEQLPPSLEESAKVDGAGYFKIFIRIVLPISMPIVATIAVFASVGQWNMWIDNFFLVSTPKLQTLQLVLYNYLNQAQFAAAQTTTELARGGAARMLTPESIKTTLTVVVTLPIMLVYPFMQKYFVKGIMLGAIKG